LVAGLHECDEFMWEADVFLPAFWYVCPPVALGSMGAKRCALRVSLSRLLQNPVELRCLVGLHMRNRELMALVDCFSFRSLLPVGTALVV